MAYQSAYAGSEIDQAVGDVQNKIWQPLFKSVTNTATDWVGSSAPYVATITISSSNTGKSVPPMVWFMDFDGNRYYCDYSVETSGNNYIITVNSNIRLAGNFYIFGIVGTVVANS